MKAGQATDPITGVNTFFSGAYDGDGERLAEMYLTIARRCSVTFREIFMAFQHAMHGPEALAEDFNLNRELRQIDREADEDLELMTSFDLPFAERVQLWKRARTRMLRLADFFPHHRKKYETQIAKHDEMLAVVLDKYLRKFGEGA
jgi:hypothetical protein